jgi:hypothetical protein
MASAQSGALTASGLIADEMNANIGVSSRSATIAARSPASTSGGLAACQTSPHSAATIAHDARR